MCGFVTDNWWQTELGGPTIATPITKTAIPETRRALPYRAW
ncbi:MAG: hypothetical protein R3A10_00765 [Caldilineaceae bacterium]